jgi:hypothetical protein
MPEKQLSDHEHPRCYGGSPSRPLPRALATGVFAQKFRSLRAPRPPVGALQLPQTPSPLQTRGSLAPVAPSHRLHVQNCRLLRPAGPGTAESSAEAVRLYPIGSRIGEMTTDLFGSRP